MESPTLISQRLLVRTWRPTDVDGLHALLRESVGHLDPWVPWAPRSEPSVEFAAELIRRWREEVAAASGLRWAIEVAQEARLVGGVGVYDRLKGEGLEVGYWIAAGATGQGDATEAVRTVVEVVQATRLTPRLEMHIDPANEASARVPERLGFTRLEAVSDAGLVVYRRDLA
jgi:RimJ/RimL family protein N-acetyltransferase